MLMNAILICPGERPTISPLSIGTPLVNLPLLGQTLLEYWLSYLAVHSAEHVLVLTQQELADGAAAVSSGKRWGLNVKTVLEARELSPDEARSKYGSPTENDSQQTIVEVLDHFPGLPDPALFGSHADFFRALQLWMPHAITPDRVGIRQVCPGVWTGVNARVSPEAQINAPCWIGQHAVVSPGAVLRPGSIIEDCAFIDTAAEVSASWIAPHTFVGCLARVTNSLAWGNQLINWQTGSATRVPDPFVLSALWRRPKNPAQPWFRRLRKLDFRQKEQPVPAWPELVVAEPKLTHESCTEH